MLRRSAGPLAFVFTMLLFSGARAGDIPTAPDDTANLSPADATYAQIVDRQRASLGTSAVSAFAVERYRVRRSDLEGTSVIARAGDDYREDESLGPLHSASGRLGAMRWTQDPNGITRRLAGVHDDSQDDSSPVLLGLSTGAHAYVVRTGAADTPHFAFYDRTTCLLVRTERFISGQWVSTSYDDFALIDGRMRARHLRRINSDGYDDYERWFQSIAVRSTVDRAALAIPETRTDYTVPGGRVRLPAKIISDRIILQTQIAKRKVNFQLDTGASTAVLDNGVAGALGLTQFGRSIQTVSGAFVAREALVPELSVGPLDLHRFFVEAGPADFSARLDTPVAGLLGGDFLSSGVFAIDYLGGTVDVLDATSFAMPKEAIVLPARFDDGVPTIDVRIGAAQSRTFILDTGADRSMLFHRFVTAHPRETIDRGLGAEQSAASPFAQHIRGVGGYVTVRTIETSDFHLGSLTFATWPFLAVSEGELAFENDDYDGLIGQDVLRYFTVYLDYPDGCVGLVPNARYAARFT